ncbi:hypothetical protein [Streptomyces sp. TR02-1]|uniref:hypothetical protein n=1 Tax=Streptomyces sp. TR02-1 TaxID=3385977 RepID=UPI0039A037DC
MGIQFTATLEESAGFVVSCFCPEVEVRAPRFDSYEEAAAVTRIANAQPERPGLPGCEDPELCGMYPLYPVPVDSAGPSPVTDLHSQNAARILDLLGMPGDACGEIPADDLLGRVLVALALTPEDAGTPTLTDRNFTYVGRSAGRLQLHLESLHELAMWCRRRGRTVVWG